jgi:hypothetical protein
LLDLLSRLPLRGATRDLRLGSGLTANRINLPYASELYLAPTFLLRSPQPALCYRPLLALRPNLAIRTVTPLEPRTPHQLEKLKKLSKNDPLFTPPISPVNEKYALVSTRVFNRVHTVHRPVTGNSATAPRAFHEGRARRGFPQHSLEKHNVGVAAIDCFEIVKIAHFPRPARSSDFDRCGDGRLRPSCRAKLDGSFSCTAPRWGRHVPSLAGLEVSHLCFPKHFRAGLSHAAATRLEFGQFGLGIDRRFQSGTTDCRRQASLGGTAEGGCPHMGVSSVHFDWLVCQALVGFVGAHEFERVRQDCLPFFDAGDHVGAAEPVGFGQVRL